MRMRLIRKNRIVVKIVIEFVFTICVEEKILTTRILFGKKFFTYTSSNETWDVPYC